MNAKGRGALAVWLIGVLACIVLVTRAEFSTDLSAFLPRSPSAAQQVLVEQLRDGLVSRLILIGVESAPPEVLALLSKDLAARLRQDRNFVSVSNGDESGLDKDRDFLWRNRYLLSSTVTPERFSPGGLRQALDNDLQLLGSSAAVLVKRTISDDPTGELLTLVSQFEGDTRPATNEGVWFWRDGKRALLVAQTRAAGFDIDAQQRALAAIHDSFAVAQKAVSDPQGARIVASGPGVFSVSTREHIKEDAWRFSALATLMVATLLLVVYRSARVLGLAMLPAASGALAGVAAVSLGFGAVHGITLGFGVTLLGEAVDYAIYLFTQTAPGSPPDKTLPRIWPTLRLGVLTSVCGFSAMLLSSFTGLAQLGLFSVVGLIVAVGVTRWVLPLLLRKDFATVRSTLFAPALVRVLQRAPRLRFPILLLIVAAGAFLGIQRDIVWDDELSSLSPVSQRDQQLDEQLRHDIGAPDVRYLLIAAAPDEEDARIVSETLGMRLQELITQNALTGFDSPTRYLPSQDTQRKRQGALPAPEILRENLKQALVGLPFRSGLFEPFLAAVAAAKTQPLLDRNDFGNTDLSLRLDSLLVKRGAGWAAMLPLRGVVDPRRLRDQIAEAGQTGVILLDLKGESDRLYETYRHQALILSLLGGLVITLLLFASLKSPRRVYEVLAPLVAAVVLTAAILVASGQRLSIFNLVGLLLVVGVGSNYSLFFERQNMTDQHGVRDDRERMVASLALANLCTVIGFGVLSFSGIPVLHAIGTTVGVGAVLSLVFSAILTVHRKAKE